MANPPSAVPTLNLAGGFKPLREEILSELAEICDSGMYILGPKVAAFEKSLAEYCGTPHAIGLSSGTDALLVALMSLDIGPGDEVIVPTFSFFATAGCVSRLGARPVFCDIRPDDFNIDPDSAGEKLTTATKAVIPVHLYGQLADMTALGGHFNRHGVPLIEDAAQAIGADDGAATPRRAGALGTIGCISFYPTKNLGAIGDAGAVTLHDEKLADKCRKLRVHGSGHTYYHDFIGGNFRIDALQAAILSVKLRRLDAWNDARRSLAARYTAMLGDAGLAPEFVRPPVESLGRHVYHQYVIRAQRRDELLEHLRGCGVGAMVYYPLPLHLQTCFADLGGKAGQFPRAEQAAGEVLALPMYPELTEGQQATVVDAIRRFYLR